MLWAKSIFAQLSRRYKQPKLKTLPNSTLGCSGRYSLSKIVVLASITGFVGRIARPLTKSSTYKVSAGRISILYTVPELFTVNFEVGGPRSAALSLVIQKRLKSHKKKEPRLEHRVRRDIRPRCPGLS
jgi:hypothetical protein